MQTKLINKADDFLGASETRYFSNGYKNIYYSLVRTVINNGFLQGEVMVGLHKNCLSVSHLGAIEYVVIACSLCERLIREEYNLSNDEVAESWIRSCYLKIKKSLQIDRNVPIETSAKIVSISQPESSINGFVSKIEVLIGDAIVKIDIDHPIKLWIRQFSVEQSYMGLPTLYVEGYKQRFHHLTNICIYPEKMECTALVKIAKFHTCNYGLGIKYDATLLPDIINISGQISQILLYTLEGIKRNKANNMWLREFSIVCPNPIEKVDFQAKILFDRFDQIKLHNEIWRSVCLTSYLGNIKANFKITHKI